jgi:Bacteriophage minor capsid protein
MTDPAEGIKDLLVTAGVGVFAATTGWGIFIGSEPDTPDTAVTIYNTAGQTGDYMFLVDYPSVQVRIRGAAGGYQAAYAKAYSVLDELMGLPAQVINGDRWDSVTAVGNVNNLGFDAKRRPLFSTNFNLIIEPATGVNRVAL